MTTALAMGCFTAVAAAAEAPTPSAGMVSVTSVPPGARVVLEGRVRVMGVTPFTVTDLPFGNYRVDSGEPGYRAKGDDLEVRPSSKLNVNVEMRRKGRLGAMTRSLFFPGWGQSYGQRDPAAGIYQVGLGLGALVAGVAALDYSLERGDFENARDAYLEAALEAETEEDSAAEWRAAQVAHNQLERSRNVLIGAGIGVGAWWALNVLDAGLLFPSFDPIPLGDRLSLRLRPELEGGVGAKLELARALP